MPLVLEINQTLPPHNINFPVNLLSSLAAGNIFFSKF